MTRLLAEEKELLAQMRACEGLIAQGRRRIEASQIRSQEISAARDACVGAQAGKRRRRR